VTGFGFDFGYVVEASLSPGKLQLKAHKSFQKRSLSDVRLLPFVKLSAYDKRRVEIVDDFKPHRIKNANCLENKRNNSPPQDVCTSD
jgi:hypothetical protein